MKKCSPVFCMIALCILLISVCCSCQTTNQKIEKVKDLEFTVVPETNIPKELAQIISEKKQTPFKLKYTSTDNEYLYIAVGYGAQNTGGYSISIEDLFLAKNAIYIDTNLIGPGRDEEVAMVTSFPYVVVKLQYQEENVVFK